MSRKSPRRKQQHIDPHIVPLAQIAVRHRFGGFDDHAVSVDLPSDYGYDFRDRQSVLGPVKIRQYQSGHAAIRVDVTVEILPSELRPADAKTALKAFVDETQPVVPQIAVLAGLHIGLGLVWLTLYAHLVYRAHRTLTRSDVKRWLEGATGVVLIALGLRVAVEPR